MHIQFDKMLKYAAFAPHRTIDEMNQDQWDETIYLLAFSEQ